MSLAVLIPGVTALLALAFAIALVDQWRERRRTYQLVWGIGMLFFGVASGCEAVAAAIGWKEALYRTWYLFGAVGTAGRPLPWRWRRTSRTSAGHASPRSASSARPSSRRSSCWCRRSRRPATRSTRRR